IVRCLRQPLAVSVAKGFAADGEDVLVHRGRSERTWRQGASDRVHGTDPVRFTASGHHLYVPFSLGAGSVDRPLVLSAITPPSTDDLASGFRSQPEFHVDSALFGVVL